MIIREIGKEIKQKSHYTENNHGLTRLRTGQFDAQQQKKWTPDAE